jgi:ribosome-binding ATPase YchF (GTP1/OBG family)
MKAGIVGLPNVGNQHYLIVCQSAKRQFSFCTIEPNIGVVNVPDSRIEN